MSSDIACRPEIGTFRKVAHIVQSQLDPNFLLAKEFPADPSLEYRPAVHHGLSLLRTFLDPAAPNVYEQELFRSFSIAA